MRERVELFVASFEQQSDDGDIYWEFELPPFSPQKRPAFRPTVFRSWTTAWIVRIASISNAKEPRFKFRELQLFPGSKSVVVIRLTIVY